MRDRLRRMVILGVGVLLLGGCYETFGSYVERMEERLPPVDPLEAPVVVVIGIDGLPGDLLASELDNDPGSYPNLARFRREGVWAERCTAQLPSLSLTCWLSLASGQPVGGLDGHTLYAFHIVDRQRGLYHDFISPEFLQKDRIFRSQGGESLFRDYAPGQAAAYGFFYADGAEVGISLEYNGFLELGLGQEAEPAAIAAWRQRLLGGAADLEEDVAKGARRGQKDLRWWEARRRGLPGRTEVATPKRSRWTRNPFEDVLDLPSGEYSTTQRSQVWRQARAEVDEGRALLELDRRVRDAGEGDELLDALEAALGVEPPLPLDDADRDSLSQVLAAARAGSPEGSRLRRARTEVLESIHERQRSLRHSMSEAVRELERQSIPRLSAFASYDFDFLLHKHGVRSEETLAELREGVDPFVGQIFTVAEEAGIADRAIFVLLSDHGATSTRNTAFLSDILERRHGLDVKRLSNLEQEIETKSFATGVQPTDVFGYDALVGSTGGGYASVDLFVRERSYDEAGQPVMAGWSVHPVYDELRNYELGSGECVDLIAALKSGILERPNVRKAGGGTSFEKDPDAPLENVLDFYLVREAPITFDDSRVRIVAPGGEARLSRRRETDGSFRYRYEVLEGQDPLGYRELPSAAPLFGGWHPDDAWRDATATSGRADLVYRISNLFDLPNCGSVIFFFADGWSGNALTDGRHGGALPGELGATLAFLGPGLPAGGRIRSARPEELRWTIARILGVEPASRLDPGRFRTLLDPAR